VLCALGSRELLYFVGELRGREFWCKRKKHTGVRCELVYTYLWRCCDIVNHLERLNIIIIIFVGIGVANPW
jgi:hypothetical protein